MYTDMYTYMDGEGNRFEFYYDVPQADTPNQPERLFFRPLDGDEAEAYSGAHPLDWKRWPDDFPIIREVAEHIMGVTKAVKKAWVEEFNNMIYK